MPALRGVARVLAGGAAMERARALAPSPALGVTFCQGALANAGESDTDMAAAFRAIGSGGPICPD